MTIKADKKPYNGKGDLRIVKKASEKARERLEAARHRRLSYRQEALINELLDVEDLARVSFAYALEVKRQLGSADLPKEARSELLFRQANAAVALDKAIAKIKRVINDIEDGEL